YIGLLGSCLVSYDGDKVFGHSTAAVVFDKDLPLVGFGLNKRADGKTRYTYVLLFKNPPGKLKGQGITGNFKHLISEVEENFTLQMGKKKLDIGYAYKSDPETGKLTSETVTLGGKEMPADGPRVFLVDLTQDSVSVKPVKVDLPDVVPDLAD